MICLVILISGCGGGSGGLIVEERYTGNTGIEYGFMQNMPPDDEIYEDSQFKIGFEMQNTGANTAAGYLSIGYEEALIDVLGIEVTDLDSGQTINAQDIADFSLEGKGSKGIGYHGQKLRTFLNLNANKIALSETQDTYINVNVCYRTKTSFQAAVCIDPDLYQEITRTKACYTQDLSFSSGQGGPVAITSVESIIIPEGDQIKPRFKITIENMGNGLIIDESKTREACTGQSIGSKSFNLIKITPTLNGQRLKCTRVNSESKFDLLQSRNQIECETSTLYNKGVGAHQEALEIELSYGYMNTLTKELTVYKKREIV